MVTCVEDILEEYRGLFPALGGTAHREVLEKGKARKPSEKAVCTPEPVPKTARQPIPSFSAEAKLLLEHLERTPKTIAILEWETRLSSAQVLAAVTELELSGYAAAYSGRRYALCEN